MGIIEERVAKGARLLDEKAPGWAEKINTDELEMGWCCDCVMGQVFPELSFTEAITSLGIKPGRDGDCPDFGLDLEFDTPWAEAEEIYEELRLLWIAEINDRLIPAETTS